MRKTVLWTLLLLICGVCQAEDVTICYKGTSVKVKQSTKDSVNVMVSGTCVLVESMFTTHRLTIRLTGKSKDGQLVLKTAGKATVKLDGLTLTSKEGAPLWLKNKKKVNVVAVNGTKNTLEIEACQDTANHKAAVIWAKDKLLLSGKGTLNVLAVGDGCRGIKSKKDITIEDLTLNVITSGNNLGEKPFEMGGFPDFANDSTFQGHFPPFPGDSTRQGKFPPFPNDSTTRQGHFPPFPNDSTKRGAFPPPNFGGAFPDAANGMPDFGGMPPEGMDSIGGFGGKHKYIASAKGITSKGKVTINSGNVTVQTSTPGAEGIEGKTGVAFNGGKVEITASDDAVNANGIIEFNGSDVIARSLQNDAVDANPDGGGFPPFGMETQEEIEPAIIVTAGTVYAWSQIGSPEEGLDSDFAPLQIEGGNIFTVGGGMGEEPSVPTQATAKQPTVLLSRLKVSANEKIGIYDAEGKLLHTLSIPFAMRQSASIISFPFFKIGETYTVKTKDYERTFTIEAPYSIVR